VRSVFYRILARDCLLHCAVLNRDTTAVETLLKEAPDDNAVDSGGRTTIHLIAAGKCDSTTCEEMTDSLLRHGAFVDAKDELLQWTAQRYAIKTENWFVVERLLQRKCRTADLELIKQRVENESYMSKIIDDIKDGNYSLLQICRYKCYTKHTALSYDERIIWQVYKEGKRDVLKEELS
jgi:ankyrin repeat protein